jgi:hypothetical protein
MMHGMRMPELQEDVSSRRYISICEYARYARYCSDGWIEDRPGSAAWGGACKRPVGLRVLSAEIAATVIAVERGNCLASFMW